MLCVDQPGLHAREAIRTNGPNPHVPFVAPKNIQSTSECKRDSVVFFHLSAWVQITINYMYHCRMPIPASTTCGTVPWNLSPGPAPLILRETVVVYTESDMGR